MKDNINQCIDEIEARILALESGKPASGEVGRILDMLGVRKFELPVAQAVALMDMLADGISPVTPEMINAFLGMVEAHKKLLYSLAGFIEDGAAAIESRKLAEKSMAQAEAPEQTTAEVARTATPEDQSAASEAEDPHPAEEHDQEEPETVQKKKGKGKDGAPQSISSIRVPTDRLDSLIELVGKLMVTYAVITAQSSDGSGSSKTAATLRELDVVIGQLQSEVDAIRLVPLKQIFMPMHRLVKSLSQKMDKKVSFVVTGDDLALDKSIVESLNEPLVHLLRNSLDHGLEGREDRVAKGKDETGIVRLTAWQKGETAFIEVSDDGRGLDPDRILAKAIERGLADPETDYAPEDIYQFVLQSGFSTAEKVTDVSGRGVGMDAVINTVRNTLDGDILISSELGKGSAFTISLPLSRSANQGIVDALVCRIGEEVFIIPSRDVVEIYVPRERDIVFLPDGRQTCDVRGEVYSLLRLGEYLNLPSEELDITRQQCVVVRVGEFKAALLVDEVLRQQQVVITHFTVPVEELYALPIMGFGMMGESDAWVVDTEKLLQEFDPHAFAVS